MWELWACPGHSLPAKELHSQQGEDHDEEEEEEQQADDGLHGVEEGDDQVPEGRPVPATEAGRGEAATPGSPSPSVHLKARAPGRLTL